MSDTIRVTHEEQHVGTLTREHFTYDAQWIERGFPLSHSLPLTHTTVFSPAINWFANLLPEGATRERIARRLRLKVDDDFQLLKALGHECAGAFILSDESRAAREAPGYRPLTEEERTSLGRSRGQLQALQEEGRLSLAGAQDKLPVRLASDGELLLPIGNAPSSHILKLPNPEFGAIVENELLCLNLARALELPVVAARNITLNDQRALLVERYDRVSVEGEGLGGLPALRRLHQEDITQALGLSRHAKYEQDDGASLAQFATLIRTSSQRPAIELRSVLRWLFFNAATGNRDNHSKNVSRLHAGTSQSRWRVAPFYDLVNTTGYSGLSRKFPFFLGGAQRLEDMRPSNWTQVAVDLGIGSSLLFREARRLNDLITNELNSVVQSTAEELGSDSRLGAVKRAITKSNRAFAASLK